MKRPSARRGSWGESLTVVAVAAWLAGCSSPAAVDAPVAERFWLGFDADQRELRCLVRHREPRALGVSFERQTNIEERDIAAKVGSERKCTRIIERHSYIGRKIQGNASKG